MSRYLVVGAGISGATVANLLSRNSDASVTVIDRRPYIGGNCADRQIDGIDVHCHGSHIVHTDMEDVWTFLREFTEFNGYVHKVSASVRGNLVSLPFGFEGIRLIFDADTAESMIRKLLALYGYGARIPIGSFMVQDDPSLSLLAGKMHEDIFLGYTIKQWGMRPEDVDGSILSRVPVIIGDSEGYISSKYQGVPVDGYTVMFRRMLDRPNITVLLGMDFSDICDIGTYDKIFFTGPVDELMGYSLGQLPYRSERFEFETIPHEYFQDTAVVNYPSLDVAYTRIHEFKHYLGEDSPVTVIAREYPEAFVPGKNEPYYPVPGQDNEALHAKYVELAKEKYPNMVFLGRLGDYRYYNMDQAVARAMDVVRTVMKSE